jgi:signal transduction histidine kinase
MSAHMSLQRQGLRPPIGPALIACAITALIAAIGSLVATAATPAAGRTPVAVCLGVAAVLLCAAVAYATYSGHEARLFRERAAALDASAARLAQEVLPAVVKRVRDGASVDTALAELPPPAEESQRRILWTIAQEIGQGERMRAAAMSACANAAGRVQALTTSMLADLRDMEDRHGEEVLGDLLKLDHSTAQAGRLADSIAVLTGARSGRRWTKPIVMESILRGAVGRIGAYQRVRLHSALHVAVVGYAAEGVMHALAELMDNAAKFSPPSEQVHVYAEEVHAGVVITIEDGGLAMSDSALRRAERKHGLTVSFRPSSRGGTGVVVMIPRVLITEPREDYTAPASRAVRSPALPTQALASDTSDDLTPAPTPPAPAEAEEEAHGLPKRRRGATFAAATAPPPVTAPPATAAPQPEQQPRPSAASRFSAFRERVGGADRGTPPSPEDSG